MRLRTGTNRGREVGDRVEHVRPLEHVVVARTRDAKEAFRFACRGEQPLAEILGELDNIQIIGRGSRNPNPSEYEIRTFGAQFVEVTVDTETGEIQVERVVASHDSGRILNPLTVSSQIEGGVLQSMGFALMEQRIQDSSGVSLNASLEGYHIPTIADAPRMRRTSSPSTRARRVTQRPHCRPWGQCIPHGGIFQ